MGRHDPQRGRDRARRQVGVVLVEDHQAGELRHDLAEKLLTLDRIGGRLDVADDLHTGFVAEFGVCRLGQALSHLVEIVRPELEPLRQVTPFGHVTGVPFVVEGKAEQRLLDLDDGRLLGLGARQELEQLGAAARLQHVVGVGVGRQASDPDRPVGAPMGLERVVDLVLGDVTIEKQDHRRSRRRMVGDVALAQGRHDRAGPADRANGERVLGALAHHDLGLAALERRQGEGRVARPAAYRGIGPPDLLAGDGRRASQRIDRQHLQRQGIADHGVDGDRRHAQAPALHRHQSDVVRHPRQTAAGQVALDPAVVVARRGQHLVKDRRAARLVVADRWRLRRLAELELVEHLGDVVFGQVEKFEQVETGAAEIVVPPDECASAAWILEAVGDRDLADGVVEHVLPAVVLLRLAEEDGQDGLQVRHELGLECSSRRAFHVKDPRILSLHPIENARRDRRPRGRAWRQSALARGQTRGVATWLPFQTCNASCATLVPTLRPKLFGVGAHSALVCFKGRRARLRQTDNFVQTVIFYYVASLKSISRTTSQGWRVVVEEFSHSAFTLTDPGVRLSRTQLFPTITASCLRAAKGCELNNLINHGNLRRCCRRQQKRRFRQR